jgi:hypothetical protein
MAPMVPYFAGFKGSTRKTKEHTWVLEGLFEREGSQIKVTELPPGKWIQDFKEHLEDLVEKGTIQKYENHSTETTPDFRIWGDVQDPVKTLGLTKTIHTSNMYLIAPNGAVKKYSTAEEILVDYIDVRLKVYRLRKTAMLKAIDEEIQWLCENRIAFNADGLLFKVLNVMHYHTFRAGAAFLTSFILSLCFGEWVIRKLISLKIGQPIRSKDEVQKLFDLHGKKAGTPTMGGIMILATFVISVLVWTDWKNIPMWICLGTTIALGGLGFLDDYEKVAKKNSKGVSARLKLVWQFGLAIISGALFA